MKILHIHINEYNTLNLMLLAYAEANEGTKRTTITGSKVTAEKVLKEETLGGRVFWWKKTSFRNIDYFQLYETIFD
jgi:hypothetical protein